MRAGERRIGPVGTAARLITAGMLLGPFLVLSGATWADVAIGLIAAPLALLLVHAIWTRSSAGRIDATGAIPELITIIVVIVLFSIDPTRSAAAVFIGATLLLAGIRGYAGCELTAIGNWLLRRDDQVGCVFLGPFDQLDAPRG